MNEYKAIPFEDGFAIIDHKQHIVISTLDRETAGDLARDLNREPRKERYDSAQSAQW